MRTIKFVKNNIYHIFNRGVEKRDIFLEDNDRWRFLQGLFLFNDVRISASLLWDLERSHGAVTFGVLKKYFKDWSKGRKPLVRILADCLMPNHYHLLVEEIEEDGITKFMHKLGTGYTNYFNKKYVRVGSLFQGTFKAHAVKDDVYLQYVLVYINVLNSAQLVEPALKEEGIKDQEAVLKFAKDYPWSTHQEYLGLRDSIIIDQGLFKDIFPDSKHYEDFVRRVLPKQKRFEDMYKFLE